MLGAVLAYMAVSRRRAVRRGKELEFTSSVSDNSPSELSKFSDLERGVDMQKLANATGVTR